MAFKSIKRRLLPIVILLLLAILLGAADRLTFPKYMTQSREGALTSDYYRDASNSHSVLFLGDCEVYESFTPPTLFEEYGITSYIRGNAQQLLWQSYYLLEDTLQYEIPQVVVLNVYAMKYGEPQNEAYNRMTLDGMRFSATKLRAIEASMTEEESFASYLFPLLRFHSRWKEISEEDFRYFFQTETVSHNGYLMQTGVEPKTSDRAGSPLFGDTSLPENAWNYLDLIRKTCEENGIRLVLIKAPTNSWGYWWYDEWEEQISAYASEHSLSYYNFIPLAEEIGINWTTDTYDGGVHLNVYGAMKLTSYFGRILSEELGLTDFRDVPEISAVWSEKLAAFNREMEALS